MSSEYVYISANEKVYTNKSLLKSQLETISLIKHLANYKNLRSQEMLLKISLKNKIEELQDLIQLIKKLLPKTSLSEKEHLSAKTKEAVKTKKKKLSLEEEVEEIRKKLAALS